MISILIAAWLAASTAPAQGTPASNSGSFAPAAVFDAAYRAAHNGKTFVEVPEVYELVNVAIALTPSGINTPFLVYQKSPYYADVRAWFDKFRNHPLISALNAAIAQNTRAYFTLKMNGYAFEFDQRGRIVQSSVYDRTGFRGETTNVLRPYLADLQSFATTSRFREFYKAHASTYAAQIHFYRDEANVAEMTRWLDRNFPRSNDYNTYKIVFSPLVYANQSTTWFESNGFKELQPHVNYPYVEDLARWFPQPLSAAAATIYRGDIVFTEINHGYINPEAERYRDRILNATYRRDAWVDKVKPSSYYPGTGTFNEYMNWALVSLRIADYAPPAEQDRMITKVEEMMTKNRGFIQFAPFDRFLLNLYRGRKPGTTVADLYPRIIAWFEAHNVPHEGSRQ